MTLPAALRRVFRQERINFLLTNRIPRRQLTRLMGWFSKVRQPLVRDLSIGVWRAFADDLELHEARKTRFDSLHDCFIRELKDGARPIDMDPAVLVSPCDAIVGASGPMRGDELIQAKGHSYGLEELLLDPELARAYLHGTYVTLRLKSNMYHRFHAPHDCRVEQVTYIPGDTWNVNPAALGRVPKLFTRNERAVLRARLSATRHRIALVPVAAILVASIRLRFVDVPPRLASLGPRNIGCDAELAKGQEMGWFEHGSTMIVLAPAGFEACRGVEEGVLIRVGQPLLRLP